MSMLIESIQSVVDFWNTSPDKAKQTAFGKLIFDTYFGSVKMGMAYAGIFLLLAVRSNKAKGENITAYASEVGFSDLAPNTIQDAYKIARDNFNILGDYEKVSLVMSKDIVLAKFFGARFSPKSQKLFVPKSKGDKAKYLTKKGALNTKGLEIMRDAYLNKVNEKLDGKGTQRSQKSTQRYLNSFGPKKGGSRGPDSTKNQNKKKDPSLDAFQHVAEAIAQLDKMDTLDEDETSSLVQSIETLCDIVCECADPVVKRTELLKRLKQAS